MGLVDAIQMSSHNISFYEDNQKKNHTHYENMPIQIRENFSSKNKKKIRKKNSDIFYISAQNIDCGYLLELHQRGGSN